MFSNNPEYDNKSFSPSLKDYMGYEILPIQTFITIFLKNKLLTFLKQREFHNLISHKKNECMTIPTILFDKSIISKIFMSR